MSAVIQRHCQRVMSLRSFESAEFALNKKRTLREKFLCDIERVVPWSRLIGVIDPLYPTSGRVGRQPMDVAKMLRMYLLQHAQLLSLSGLARSLDRAAAAVALEGTSAS